MLYGAKGGISSDVVCFEALNTSSPVPLLSQGINQEPLVGWERSWAPCDKQTGKFSSNSSRL